MSHRGVTVLLGLVHNNNTKRLETARDVVGRIESALTASNFDVTLAEASSQTPNTDGSRARALQAAVRDAMLMHRWSGYCDSPRPARTAARAAWTASKDVFDSVPTRMHPKVRVQIETKVTQKHINLWEEALRSHADWVVVLEDDVVWDSSGPTSTISQIIWHLREWTETAAYIDFVGGFPLSRLNVQRLVINRHDEVSLFRKPVSNCAAGYAISQPLLQSFLAHVSRKRRLKRIGIDFLLNWLFMNSIKSQTRCAHINPSAILHGSFTGHYESWDT
jgi:hypothetical protein